MFASLSFEGSTEGMTALSIVSEDYFTSPGGVLIPDGLTVYSTFDQNTKFYDIQDVGGQMSMHMKKDIGVTGIFEGAAEITKVSQNFYTAPIPEPSAALLFVAGAGLISTRVRRKNQAS